MPAAGRYAHTFRGVLDLGSFDADGISAGANGIAFAGPRPFISASALKAAGNGTTDDSAILQAALNTLASVGGGDLLLDQPSYGLLTGLVINSKDITIRGYGANWRHSSTTSSGATTLRALTSGMTMVQFAAPAVGAQTNHGGGGMDGIYFDANGNAAIGLEVLSWRFGRFRWIGGNLFSTAGIHLGVIPSWDSNDTRSPQKNEFDQISIGGYSVHSGHCMLIDGDTSNGLPQAGNSSLNTFRDLELVHTNGDGIHWGNSDNDLILNAHITRPSGAGFPIFFAGAAYSGGQSRAQTIIHYTSNASCKVEGTDTAVQAAGTPVFYAWDQDNSTPLPTVGTGAGYRIIDSTGVMVGSIAGAPGWQAVGMVIGETRTNAVQAPGTNATLTLYNSSQAQLVMSNNTQTGRLYMSGNGPVLSRLAGGSFTDLEGGLHVQGTTFVDILAGHLISSAAGTPGTSNLGANITSVTFTGNDVRGKIVIVASGVLAANTRIATCTWVATFGAVTPLPMLVSETSGAGLAIVNFYSGAESATAFDLFCEQALAAGTYTLRYINIG